MKTPLRRLLAAILAAVRDPHRTLACLHACEGVHLRLIEVHDHDYTFTHLHDQVEAAGALCEHYASRLQDVVAERNRLAAELAAERAKHAATGGEG